MSVQLVSLTLLVIFEAASMHRLPCSSLGHCFDNPRDADTDPASPQEPNISPQSKNNHVPSTAAPVTCQPEALPSSLQEQRYKQSERTISSISICSTSTRKVNDTNSTSICHLEGTDDELCFESPTLKYSVSQSSEDEELEFDCSPEVELKYPKIPRPSIIIRLPQVGSLTLVIENHMQYCNDKKYTFEIFLYDFSTFVL